MASPVRLPPGSSSTSARRPTAASTRQPSCSASATAGFASSPPTPTAAWTSPPSTTPCAPIGLRAADRSASSPTPASSARGDRSPRSHRRPVRTRTAVVPRRRLAGRLRHPRSPPSIPLRWAAPSRFARARPAQVAVGPDRLRGDPRSRARRPPPRVFQPRAAVPAGPSGDRPWFSSSTSSTRSCPFRALKLWATIAGWDAPSSCGASPATSITPSDWRPRFGPPRSSSGGRARAPGRHVPHPRRRRRPEPGAARRPPARRRGVPHRRPRQRPRGGAAACFMHFGTTDADVDRIVPAVLRVAAELRRS